MIEAHLPPHNLDAEQAILGAMMVNPNTIPYAMEVLDEEDFYRDTHRKVFAEIRKQWAQDETGVDQLTVAAAMDMEDKPFIYTLAEFVPVASNAKQYVDIVKRDAVLRGIIKAGNEIAESGYEADQEPDVDIAKVVDEAERKLTALRPNMNKNVHVASALAMRVMDSIESGEAPKRVTTGFASIDEYAKGFYAGNLIIVGARPGVGKTCLGLAVARRVAEQGAVAFFSMEMKAEELYERMMASEACVSLTRIRERHLNDDEKHRLRQASDTLSQLDLRIVDDSGMSAMQLSAKVRNMSKRTELKLVVVDYLQLMNMGAGKTESRQIEVSEMSRKMKQLAMELNIPIMCLSQLNRASTFEGQEVDISQLRESGSLEQDADMVWLLYWPKTDDFHTKSLTVKIGKNRNGPLGKVDLIWLPQYQRYEE